MSKRNKGLKPPATVAKQVLADPCCDLHREYPKHERKITSTPRMNTGSKQRVAGLKHRHNAGLAPARSYVSVEESELLFERSHDLGTVHWERATSTSEAKSLGAHFHALPSELRDEIFAHLLVRPCKWDVEHLEDCKSRHETHPSTNDHTQIDSSTYSCAMCIHHDRGASAWRHEFDNMQPPPAIPYAQGNYRKPIYVDPWRSEWAPTQMNPYLCTACYNSKHRPRPFPQARRMPCICARRPNLQLLLVCRQWREEASRVFYTRNTFGFEDDLTFIDFIAALQPKWADLISKVSIMAPVITADYTTTQAEQAEFKMPSTRVWTLLRQLPALSYLELPCLFLTRAMCLDSMRKVGFSNLKKLNFVYSPLIIPKPDPYVWPQLARRTVVVGGLAEQMARAMKGQPVLRDTLRRGRLLRQDAAEREQLEYLARRNKEEKENTDGITGT